MARRMTAPQSRGSVGSEAEVAPATSGPGRIWLGLVLLLPGGLLIALGLLAAWPGLALLVSGLRRLSTVSRSTREVDEATCPVGTPVTGSPQPYGQPCQPSPRWGVN
jgi:hypothetical protein